MAFIRGRVRTLREELRLSNDAEKRFLLGERVNLHPQLTTSPGGRGKQFLRPHEDLPRPG